MDEYIYLGRPWSRVGPTPPKGAEPFHGTTTVGLIAGDHVVLAADKRATAGFFIASRKVKKIVKITDYAAMTISGLVADAQTLAEFVREEAKFYELTYNVKPTVKWIANLLSTILFSSKWFPYIVQLIVGGYDVKPRIYTLDPYGSVTEEKYTATGSGSPVAIGVIESEYREDLTLDDAMQLAAKAVKAATLRDVASGDGVDVLAIGKDGMIEKFIPLK